MGHVLVGVDGSKAATAALVWASRFALATDESVVALHAMRRPYAEIPPGEQQRLVAEREEIMKERWMQPAIDERVLPRTVVIEGDPRTTLVTAADDHDVDLVVLGRTGAGGGPGFLHLGSVVEHAAHHLNRPLAVIPSDGGGPVRRIVLGVDGSKASAAAVEWCARAASALGAEVVAVVVEEPVAEWTPEWDDKNWRRDAEREIGDWAAPLIDAGVAVETVVAENLHPVDGLLGVASARSADLLVLGTRGAGGFTGLRFGGVALKTLHRVGLPLVLVPPPEEG